MWRQKTPRHAMRAGDDPPQGSVLGKAMESFDGGSYALSGTVGQPDAGEMSGGPYSLSGGFWNEAVTNPERALFLPLVVSE